MGYLGRTIATGLMLAGLLVAWPGLAGAATRVVDADGTYDAGTATCSGSDAAFTTIQGAVTAAADGDTILVCPGTYSEAQIVINKALSVQSVAGAATTIIDGTGGTGLSLGGTVRLTAPTGNVLFDGFTLQNAKARTSNGARFNISVGSTAAVTITVTHNVLIGTNNPADGGDYGLYAAGPNANDTLVFQHNQLLNHGSNTILIERHEGPTDVSYNTFTRGVRSLGISAYINMSHSGTAVTSLQRVSHNTIDMANDPGPYTSANSSSAIVFNGALTGTTLGTFSNVEISDNTILNLRSYRRGIVLTNGASTLANQALGVISNAVISCNTMTWSGGPAEAGSYGIRLFGYVTNTAIGNNAIEGVDVGVMVEPRNGHIANAATADNNSIAGTVTAAVYWQSSGALAAENNWWGADSGPTNGGNPGGTGGIVLATGPVDFAPWLMSASDASPGPCFVPGCGNGAADANEDCDAGVLNGDPSVCCTTSCTYRGAGEECRAAGGVCDLAESCSGASGICPADAKSTAECRAASDVCDAAESCDGIGNDCPTDARLPAGTDCRTAMGVCDVAEQCDGVSPACPADAKSTGLCRPAADVCDLAESCDGIADTCPSDGFAGAGMTCRAAAGDCDVAETCSGAAAACPADAKALDGTVCSDGDTCTQSDTCQSGACGGGAPLDCDDGNGCTVDSCDPMGGCVNDDAPATGCLTAAKSTVVIREGSDDSKDKLLWKWRKGPELSQLDFADPTAGTGYALCVYAGSGSALIADAALPPGPSWNEIGTRGYKFKGSSPDGLTLAILKGGSAGKSQATARGKGADLPDPTLPVAYPVTVQLRKSGSPLCLESTFTSADEKKNTTSQFKAKVK